MMKLFNRAKKLVTKLTETETQVIERIHNEFEIAADSALAEAKKILSRGFDNSEIEYGEKLSSLGFYWSVPARKATEHKRNIGDQKKRADTVMKWQTKYPQYKLIFLDQVESICKKYGLLLGPASDYRGDVPRKNIDEIADFKLLDEDRLYMDSAMSNTISRITRQPLGYHQFDRVSAREHRNQSCPFYICAPTKDFNTDVKIKDGFQIVVSDPIVLMPIEERGEAFFVVSKWGIEGDDVALVNEKSN